MSCKICEKNFVKIFLQFTSVIVLSPPLTESRWELGGYPSAGLLRAERVGALPPNPAGVATPDDAYSVVSAELTSSALWISRERDRVDKPWITSYPQLIHDLSTVSQQHSNCDT